jgi:hypothetical protein
LYQDRRVDDQVDVLGVLLLPLFLRLP